MEMQGRLEGVGCVLPYISTNIGAATGVDYVQR